MRRALGSRLEIRGLSVDLGEFHLRGIDLSIASGEYFVILGPTGGGKTVLLETIAGLHRPRAGRILLDGEDITAAPPERRGMGFVYQDYALFPHLSVRENIAFGLRLRGLSRPAVAERLAEVGDLLAIGHLFHRPPSSLSGGEQQRVALARALVVEPRLLLLDEPLSALDPETRERLQRELGRLRRELGLTVVHVTHDFEEAVALGDRLAVMHAGRVVQVGPPEEVFRRPATEFVARFVGVRNIFEGRLRPGDDGYQVLPLGAVEVAVVTELSGRAHISVRPEEIIISREPLRSSARNAFRGRVVEVSERGALAYITVRVPPEFTGVVTRRSLEELALREGEEVWIAFKASAVHVF